MPTKSLWLRLWLGCGLGLGISFAAAYIASQKNVSPFLLIIGGALFFLVFGVWLRALLRPMIQVNDALANAILSLKNLDFSVNLYDEKLLETSPLIGAYNELTDCLRQERQSLRQQTLLMETVLESAPVALILTRKGRVVYSNEHSKTLFMSQNTLDGQWFSSLSESLSEELKQATHAKQSGLVSFSNNDQQYVYQLQCKAFKLNSLEHWLYLYVDVSRSMSQQEQTIWRNLIRLISHELNNSLAPIQSLANSAKTIVQHGEHIEMLDDILSTIAKRSQHLNRFLQGYIQYAKLPKPSCQSIHLHRYFSQLEPLLGVACETSSQQETAYFDPVQLDQVLLNLVKNAKESGSDHSDIGVNVQQQADQLVFWVFDRGTGMTAKQLSQALQPFYSTKPAGSGIGLALSHDIIRAHQGDVRLYNRKHGGLCVKFHLPLNTHTQYNP